MNAKPKFSVRLGQEAFVVSKQGEVVLTMVAKIHGDGYYLLTGQWCCSPPLSYAASVSLADQRLKAREKELRKALSSLKRRRKILETDDYEQNVRRAPYKVKDLRDVENPFRTRELRGVTVPEKYHNPGDRVYVVITPLTRNIGDVYRPYKHFVLETLVFSVCFTPDGKTHYALSTTFEVVDFFTSREEAERHLSNFSEPGTKELIHFVSREEDEWESKKIADANIPFCSR